MIVERIERSLAGPWPERPPGRNVPGSCQVEAEPLRCFHRQAVQVGAVAFGEIHYVDVVPYARPVGVAQSYSPANTWSCALRPTTN